MGVPPDEVVATSGPCNGGFGGRSIVGKRKEKKLTVEAGQPGVHCADHAGFRTCVIHQSPVKIRKSLYAVLSKKDAMGRKMMGEKEKRRQVDATAYMRCTLHLSQNHVVTSLADVGRTFSYLWLSNL